MTVLSGVAGHSGSLAWRNLLAVRRTPGSLFTAVAQPLIFVLLLGFVFGGSLGGGAYREFLMGGIFAQTVTFNASFTAIGLANDLQKGIVDRFRSLPIPRIAVLLGRTMSDLVTSAVSLAVTSACGLAIGWRIRGSVLDAILAYLLILLFAFAMSWVGALVGLIAGSVEVTQSLGLIWLFPVSFVSSAFVSINALPEPLATIATWNPVSSLAGAARQLFANPIPAALKFTGGPAGFPVPYSALTSVLIVAVFATLAVTRYRQITTR